MLFTDQLTSPEAMALLRGRTANHIDLQPLQTRAIAKVLPNLHQYQDSPLTSYFVAPGSFALIPKDDPPFRFVFFPEFGGCRLLVKAEGEGWLRLSVEEGLSGRVPPAETQRDSPYVDSFAYWDYTGGILVGRIRATAVLVKEPGQPWSVYMQQIVGTPGFEVVRSLFTKTLRYS